MSRAGFAPATLCLKGKPESNNEYHNILELLAFSSFPYRKTTPDKTVSAVVQAYTKHGLTTLKQAMKGLGGRVIDRRTTLGRSLAQWRNDSIRDLGGDVFDSTGRDYRSGREVETTRVPRLQFTETITAMLSDPRTLRLIFPKRCAKTSKMIALFLTTKKPSFLMPPAASPPLLKAIVLFSTTTAPGDVTLEGSRCKKCDIMSNDTCENV